MFIRMCIHMCLYVRIFMLSQYSSPQVTDDIYTNTTTIKEPGEPLFGRGGGRGRKPSSTSDFSIRFFELVLFLNLDSCRAYPRS